jgi:hypothetical protein
MSSLSENSPEQCGGPRAEDFVKSYLMNTVA